MPQEPKVDSVQSALSDLMSLEQERLTKEEKERRQRDEEERKRRAAEEAKRKAEEEARLKSEEEMRLARIKSEQDEMERKAREKELQEMELKKKLEIDRQIKEQELRLKHDEQIKQIEASAKKGFPTWGYVVIAIVILAIAGGAVGIVMNLQKKSRLEKEQLQRESEAALALERKKAEERDKQINVLLSQLQSMKDESQMTADELKEKKQLEDLLRNLQDEKATSGHKKKKGGKGGTGTEKKGDDLSDPLGGI